MKKDNGLSVTVNRVFRRLTRIVANMSFFGMAFFCFLLRVLVKQPWGPLLALIVGCIWIVSNMAVVKQFFDKISFWLKNDRA